MNTMYKLLDLPLAKRALHHLSDDTLQVTCRSGSIWITEDNDTRDTVLQPGDSFTPRAGHHAILYGLNHSVAVLHTPCRAPNTVRRRARSPVAHGLVMEQVRLNQALARAVSFGQGA